ncbi:MAG: Holliday junction branch migration protein RuvA [Pseudomonadota bacterium]|jgi:Holliday junction DNA helicase RuvA|nr:Holliday junction branch migration protein RuvA [Pseudomonadota bacterium]
MIIGRLRGTIAAVGLDSVMVDVNGVGYIALAGTRLLSKLTVGSEAEVFIETRVTENSITLFAFATDEERAWFVRLQDVPGVAGKSAMAIMDAISAPELMDALALGDAATITRAKGVGKKLAERIIGELSGKPPPMGRFGKFTADPTGSVAAASELKTGARGEAVSALINLGYSQSEAARAVATAARDLPDAETGVLIKAALKELSPA